VGCNLTRLLSSPYPAHSRGPDSAEVAPRALWGVLDDADMLRIMARENMEEWGTVATIEHETVRAVIDAYAAGKIELPAIGAKVSRSNVCNAPSVIASDADAGQHPHPYTRRSWR